MAFIEEDGNCLTSCVSYVRTRSVYTSRRVLHIQGTHNHIACR